MRKPGIAGWIIIALAALGLLQIVTNPSITWLIPIVIIAIVVALYFLLPNSRRPGGFRAPGGGKRPKVKPSARTQEKLARMSSSGSSRPSNSNSSKSAAPAKNAKKKKSYPFQVIEGRKGKDDEDIPKFH